jgi:hypothetical protein
MSKKNKLCPHNSMRCRKERCAVWEPLYQFNGRRENGELDDPALYPGSELIYQRANMEYYDEVGGYCGMKHIPDFVLQGRR